MSSLWTSSVQFADTQPCAGQVESLALHAALKQPLHTIFYTVVHSKSNLAAKPCHLKCLLRDRTLTLIKVHEAQNIFLILFLNGQQVKFPRCQFSCNDQHTKFIIYSQISTCVSNKSRGFVGNPGMSVSSSSVMPVLLSMASVPELAESGKPFLFPRDEGATETIRKIKRLFKLLQLFHENQILCFSKVYFCKVQNTLECC